MRLTLFDQIDATLALYQSHLNDYHRHEKVLVKYFTQLFDNEHDFIAGINSRVKTCTSLREKIIRSRVYLRHEEADEILNSMSDLIGLTLECRFVRDERMVLEFIRSIFSIPFAGGLYHQEDHPHIRLDLASPQPQMQKNGYEIYRVDGYLIENGREYRFEVQIKALVNMFWSNIEHKLVYKNTNYYVYDGFMKEILGSIKANLLTIDNQLSIVYSQIQNVNQVEAGLSEDNFEKLITKALNDLFALKMNDSIGFNIDIKNMSAIVSHYIFVKDLKYEKSMDRFTRLFETFKRLGNTNIDFESRIDFEGDFVSDDVFCSILGQHLYQVINQDYEWYVFFKMLFYIEPGNNLDDFTLFLNVIRTYLFDNYWFRTSFARMDEDKQQEMHEILLALLAQALVEQGTIRIIDTSALGKIREMFTSFVNALELYVPDFETYEQARTRIEYDFKAAIGQCFV